MMAAISEYVRGWQWAAIAYIQGWQWIAIVALIVLIAVWVVLRRRQ